jgi:hypothetical protein
MKDGLAHMTIGFKLLDNAQLRRRLADLLYQAGYTLGTWDSEPRLIARLVIPLEPLGRGPRFLLRLEQGLDQEWRWGVLLNHDASAELARFDFDTAKHYTKSCYEVWMEQIVEAVRHGGVKYERTESKRSEEQS